VLDLDGFSEINEALGYGVGDEVLRETGRRLLAGEPGTGRVARLGNDEFAVILSGVSDPLDAERRAGATLAVVDGSFRTAGLQVDIRASGGVAADFTGRVDAAALLQRADAALYEAKNERSTLLLWDEADEGRSARRLALLVGLRTALAASDLYLHYQPKVDPRTGVTTGAEALVRWHHPKLGQVGPDEFVPLAEHSGLVHPLTAFVLASALERCAGWRRTDPGFTIAVNLSTRSLLDPNLVDQVRDALQRADVPAGCLTLEITETAVMTDLEQSLTVLRRLRQMGVRLSIDDYGTGQSSLAYLKNLPVHEVKVDRSFVSGITTDRATPRSSGRRWRWPTSSV
jgi:diguanylate cyclase (GGDEF)-like protein